MPVSVKPATADIVLPRIVAVTTPLVLPAIELASATEVKPELIFIADEPRPFVSPVVIPDDA